MLFVRKETYTVRDCMKRFPAVNQQGYHSIRLKLFSRPKGTITKLIKHFAYRTSCSYLLSELIYNVRDWLEVCIDSTRLTYLTRDDGTTFWC